MFFYDVYPQVKYKSICSNLETYDPWYSYNELPINNVKGYQAGGSGGKTFSLQYLQQTIEELTVSYDSFSIRSLNLKFTNGKSKQVGSKNLSIYGQNKIYEEKFMFQPGETLHGKLILGEAKSYMSKFQSVKNLLLKDDCYLLSVSYIKFSTNLERIFETGITGLTTNYKSYDIQNSILAGLMGSADNYINRLAFILYKPVKKQYINKIFWPTLDSVKSLIQEGEALNKNESIVNNSILHRGLKFHITYSEEKCNYKDKNKDFHLKYEVKLGNDFIVKFNIPYLSDKESLLYFFTTFSKHKYDEFGSFNDDLYVNLNSLDTNYDTILNNQTFTYDHLITIKKFSCVKFKYHSVEGLNKGLTFDIHYKMEFYDGTDFEAFYEGIYKAKDIVIPDHEKIEYTIKDCNKNNSFINNTVI